MVEIPASYADLFTTKKAFAHLATVGADGAPQVTPVWIDANGSTILVNSARGRAKDRNMTRDAKVGISIVDPENPYRHVSVHGHVSRITEEGASAHIDAMAKKYLGVDKYPFARPGEVRVLYEITVDRVHTMG